MIYLILKISLYLILAALVGVAVGWFLKQIAAKEKEEKLRRDLNATRSRIPQLETNIRNREQQASRLELEVEEWQGKLPSLQATIEEKDRLVLERDRTIAAMQSELSILKQQTPQSSDPLFGGEELDLTGEINGVNLETGNSPALAQEDDNQSELREALESREQELQQQTRELHDKQSELDALSVNLAQVTETLAERDRLIDELDAEVTRYQHAESHRPTEPQETENEPVVSADRQELIDLEQRLKRQQEDFDSVTRVLDDQNARVQELTREAQDHAEEVRELTSELKKAREAVQEGSIAQEAKDEHIRSLEQRLQDQSSSMAESLAGYSEKIDALKAERDESVAALEELSTKLNSSQDLARKLAADLKESIRARELLSGQEKTNRQRLQEMSDIRAGLEAVESQNRSYADTVRALEESLQQQEQRQSALVADYDDRIASLNAEKGDLTSQKETLQQQLEGIQQQLESTRDINRSLSAELSALQQNQAGLLDQQADFDERSQEVERLRVELQQAESAREIRDQHIKELEKRIQDQTESMAEVLNGHTDKVTVLSQINAEREATLVDLRRQVEDLEQLNRDMEGELEQSRLTQQAADEDLARLREELAQQNARLESLQSQHEQSKQTSVARITELETCMADLETSIAEKTATIDELNDTLARGTEDSKQRLEELNLKAQAKDEQIESLEQALATRIALAEEEKASLTAQLKDLSGEHQQQESLIQQLTDQQLTDQQLSDQQLSEKEQEIARLAELLKQSSEALEEAIEGQKTELAQRDALLQEKSRELESAWAQLDGMQEDARRYAGVSSEVEQLRTLVDDLRAEQKEHELETAVLQEELAKLEGSLAEKNKAFDDLQRQKGQSSDAVIPLVQAVQAGPLSDYEDHADSNDDGKRQVLELQRSLAQVEQEHERLQKERERQEKTLLILNQQLEDARATNSRLATDRAKWKKAAQNAESQESVPDFRTQNRSHDESENNEAQKNVREKAQKKAHKDDQEKLKKPSCLLSEPPVQIDDLKQIKGIGKALEKSLHQLGLYQFAQLVELGDEDIQWIDAHLDRFRGRIIRDDWVAQAGRLHTNGQ